MGKTYALLAAARAAQTQGRAVLVGLVETHGCSDTEAMSRELTRPARATPNAGEARKSCKTRVSTSGRR